MKTERFLKCIADENRRNILFLIGNQEKCVCEIIDGLNLEQSLISHHLQKLKGCGLVSSRQDGKNIYYKISNEKIKNILDRIEEVATSINCTEEC